MSSKGYFSILQFCPDRARLEAANVGVVLFVPELSFLKARMTGNSDRPRRFFGQRNVNSQWLRTTKEAISHRLEREAAYLRTPKDFQKFVDTRANQLLLSKPRPVRVGNPEQELERLFSDLVSKRRKPSKARNVIPELERAFSGPKFRGRVRKHTVTVPVLDRELRVPYAYMNGSVNLIRPQEFKEDNDFVARASVLATESNFLKKATAPIKLIVVPDVHATVSKKDDMHRALREIFAASEVRPVWEGERSSFIEEVDRDAKPFEVQEK